jgi:hypothetical protein
MSVKNAPGRVDAYTPTELRGLTIATIGNHFGATFRRRIKVSDPGEGMREGEYSFRTECHAFINWIIATRQCQIPAIRDNQSVGGLMSLSRVDFRHLLKRRKKHRRNRCVKRRR